MKVEELGEGATIMEIAEALQDADVIVIVGDTESLVILATEKLKELLHAPSHNVREVLATLNHR